MKRSSCAFSFLLAAMFSLSYPCSAVYASSAGGDSLNPNVTTATNTTPPIPGVNTMTNQDLPLGANQSQVMWIGGGNAVPSGLVEFGNIPTGTTTISPVAIIDTTQSTGSPAFVVTGAGQTNDGINTNANSKMGATLDLADTGYKVGNGGALIFSANSEAWKFAAIKGYVTNGSNNSQGDITFETRVSPTDGSLTDVMHIMANGNVGIGTSSPIFTLDVTGISSFGGGVANVGPNLSLLNPLVGTGRTAIAWNATNGFGETDFISNRAVNSYNGGFIFYDYSNAGVLTPLMTLTGHTGAVSIPGAVSIGNSVTAYAYYHNSDMRLKSDIKPITGALDKLLSIRGVQFNWKKDGRPDMGIVAQDVAAVFPDVVTHDKNNDGMMAVEYDSLVGPIIESIRELKSENDTLKAELVETNAKLKVLQENNRGLHSTNARSEDSVVKSNAVLEP